MFLFGVPVVFAQEGGILSADSTRFHENYDPEVPVSGGAIVGISLGRLDGDVDVENVRLPSFSGDSVCVRIVTQDGRYSANNVYRKTGSGDPKGTVLLTPVSLKYAEALSKYKMSAFALNAFIPKEGTSDPQQAIHLPQMLPDADKIKTLTVLVNSGGRFSKMTMNEAGSTFLCQNVKDGARIAYDTVCKGDLATYTPGVKSVLIILDDGFGEESIHFSLLLP
ncbi:MULTISPECIES: hypothetical protein [unclassified Pseudodesulfovibrio]|uniref:hypothetical protein n=1 Tax=unclassified Pseudodesulfovibrio TaxID=2661612 RepID=UPI000FEBB329|nr:MULTISPECIES: hypothetical protein [unclassified Pseudodesulfovibrio]MCJ2164677.1 hypothetical protein [Pseudodesulfovibrio sp. S3-i]RWU04131.1 hypothetical protein DWB63_08990 [Pseudodesulfovibrio sp. S3]